MSEADQNLSQEQSAAIAHEALRGFSGLPGLLEDLVVVITSNAEVMKAENECRRREINQRFALAKLEQETAIVCEAVARQSRFITRSIASVERRSGVELSPMDFLCGVLNGLEQSGVDLSDCGTRKDVSMVIESLIKQGVCASQDKNLENDQ